MPKPKGESDLTAARYMNSFLDDTVVDMIDRHNLDPQYKNIYKNMIFNSMECIRTNNLLNFIFVEKDVDKFD
jgi:hypothetical protein